MNDDLPFPLAGEVFEACRAKRLTIATAESCTGGMIAAALTDMAGSSAVFDRGFVTYSNKAKAVVLGVDTATLRAYGAVSAETVREMVLGALQKAGTDLAVAVTGIAGPGGGSDDKPVGLVWFGAAARGSDPVIQSRVFDDRGRAFIRHETVNVALEMLAALARSTPARSG